ncbi:MAG: ribosome recycling factor [Prevotella sp.]|nr:ribosome recycling factor [Prevotella sp.]
MSNKEVQEFSAKLKKGLEIAEKKMLQEKALLGESIVVCDSNNNIMRIPASEVIAKHKAF